MDRAAVNSPTGSETSQGTRQATCPSGRTSTAPRGPSSKPCAGFAAGSRCTATGSSTLYYAELKDGGHCTEITTSGVPRGAVCKTAAQAQVTYAESQVKTAEAQLAKARVAVEQAAQQRAYTTIRAPIAGTVTNKRVQVGDYVMTTGQDGIYPPGLNVGDVVDVKNGTATQPHQILIRPGARLDRLEEVAVLLYRAPQRTAPEQTLPNVDKPKK